jgi:hypothetical protein
MIHDLNISRSNVYHVFSILYTFNSFNLFNSLIMAQPSSVMALSAPGKVLLTGGYLCLDRGYTGTVFALDARIHVIVQQLQRGHRRGVSTSTETEEEAQDTVVVRSPQFLDAVWEYGVQRCANGGGVKVVQKGDAYVLHSANRKRKLANKSPASETPSSKPPSAMH